MKNKKLYALVLILALVLSCAPAVMASSPEVKLVFNTSTLTTGAEITADIMVYNCDNFNGVNWDVVFNSAKLKVKENSSNVVSLKTMFTSSDFYDLDDYPTAIWFRPPITSETGYVNCTLGIDTAMKDTLPQVGGYAALTAGASGYRITTMHFIALTDGTLYSNDVNISATKLMHAGNAAEDELTATKGTNLPAAPAGGSPKIELVVPRDAYAAGESFTVDVYVKSASFSGVAYGISYDQSKLTLDSYAEATGFGVSRTDNLTSSGKLGRSLYPQAGGNSSVVSDAGASGIKIDSLAFTVKAGQSGAVALTPSTISGSPDLSSKSFILASNGSDVAGASIAVTYTATLADYKATKCTELEGYKDAADYATYNATAFANAVTSGKASINAAVSFTAVDSALTAAKGVIDLIQTDEEIEGGALADAEALIDEISTTVGIGDKAKIREAKAAYDELSPALQSQVNSAKAAKLNAAVKSLTLWTHGDINFDGIINIYDLSKLLYVYGSADEASNINEIGNVVNAEDLSLLLLNYGDEISDL